MEVQHLLLRELRLQRGLHQPLPLQLTALHRRLLLRLHLLLRLRLLLAGTRPRKSASSAWS